MSHCKEAYIVTTLNESLLLTGGQAQRTVKVVRVYCLHSLQLSDSYLSYYIIYCMVNSVHTLYISLCILTCVPL